MRNQRNLSIVLPYYNKKAAFKRTFRVLKTQLIPGDEVIVVDDHSPQGVMKCATCRGLTIVRPPELDKHIYRVSTLRNLGIKTAKHDAVIILDPDCIPNPDFLENARKFFDPSVLFAGRIVHVNKDGEVYRSDSRAKGPSQWIDDNPIRGGASIWGGCLLFSKSRVELIGLFDEAYNDSWGAEDGDFGYRCYHSGMRLRWEPGLMVTHQWHEENHPNVEVNRKLWKVKRTQYPNSLHAMTPYKPAAVVLIASLKRPQYLDQVMRAVFRTRIPLRVRLVNQGDFSAEHMAALAPWRNRWAVEVIDNKEAVRLAEVRTQCMKDYADKYKYMITLDNDVLPLPGSIERLLAAMKFGHQYHAIAGGVKQGGQSRMLGGYIKDNQHYSLPIVKGTVEVDFVSSGFTASRLDSLIPYDTEYGWGWNDWDWSNEITKQGGRLAVCGDALSYHKYLLTPRGLEQQVDDMDYQMMRYNKDVIKASTERFETKWGYKPLRTKIWDKPVVEREI